ncbi:EamA family transporter [Streptomyces sp. Da 82-17]|uniref:EamA family transporter n=1 Tax=Streptomyces sp. Da 82-17 TaxID=3377116 RepID=UPI0038D409B0
MTTTTAPPAPSAPSPSAPATAAGRAGLTLATAFAPAVWGTTYVVTTELLPPDAPLFAGLMRALPAGLLGLLVARTLPRGAWWWKAGVLGALNVGVFFPLLFLAAERLPGGVAATLGASQPILVAFLAVLILSERLSPWRLGWGVVGVVGVGLVVLGPGAAFDPLGIAAGLGGAAAMGTGVVLTKRWGRPEGVSAVGFAGWQLTAGGLVLVVPTLLVEGVPGGIDGQAVAGYVWLGTAGGLVAYTLWFRGLRSLPVTATALLGLLSPLVATVLGVLLSGETLAPLQLLGFALALAALAAGQITPASRSSRSSSS